MYFLLFSSHLVFEKTEGGSYNFPNSYTLFSRSLFTIKILSWNMRYNLLLLDFRQIFCIFLDFIHGGCRSNKPSLHFNSAGSCLRGILADVPLIISLIQLSVNTNIFLTTLLRLCHLPYDESLKFDYQFRLITIYFSLRSQHSPHVLHFK